MLKKYLCTLLGLLFCAVCYSQSNPVMINKYIRLPNDSVQLVTSLNGFLGQLTKANKDNEFVLKDDLLATSLLMDEMKRMTDAGPDKKNFYKCHLSNAVLLDSLNYVVQLSYMAVDGSEPVLRAGFKLIAQKQGDRYYFNSPLKRNTREWQVKKTGNFIVYRNSSNPVAKLDLYIKNAIATDKKLHAPNYTTEIYYCDNSIDALELIGVDYKLDYVGIPFLHQSSFENGNNLHIMGAKPLEYAAFDLHDMWHNRLHHVVSTDIIYRPMDEACAYLCGGSWDISWPDIFKQFKTVMGADHDWLATFNAHKMFGSPKAPLYTDYVICALLAQKIEKENGFKAVIDLLSCGKKEPENVNFFKTLDKINGINKANFNTEVDKLVAEGVR